MSQFDSSGGGPGGRRDDSRAFVPPAFSTQVPAETFETGGEAEFNVMEYVQKIWFHRWKILVIAVVTTVLFGALAATRPKLYRATTKIAIQQAPRLSSSPMDAAGSNYWEMERYVQGELQILGTRELAARAARQLGLTDGGATEVNAAHSLLGRLSAQPIEQTNVIAISMVGTDPRQVAEWLNVYVQEYIEANIEDSIERTRQVFNVIQERLEPLRERVSAAEQALVTFRERDDTLFFADEEKNVISEQVNRLTTDYAAAKAERIQLETKINALRAIGVADLGTLTFPEVMRDSVIQGLKSRLSNLELELSTKLQEYREGHPEIQALRNEIQGMERRIQEQVAAIRATLSSEYDVVRRRERSLYDNIQQLKQETIDLSKQTLQFERLQREYEQNKRFLEDMMSRSREADISMIAFLNNIRVIEPAIPPGGPFSPNVPRSVAVGLMLGLVLGVGLALAIDLVDQTLRTPDDIEKYTGLDVLSTLPKFTDEHARVLREAFQSLRTALILAARGEGCQVLMISSAVPEEGKTTVAFNLAKVFASAGSRVLLIDADLRKPRLHRLIKAKNVRGLTSVVLGEREARDVIHAHAEVPTLDMVTSGPLPPNPPELFGKASFRAMLDWARSQYDWVVIDTPPVSSVTDPVMCATNVDMALLVIQYGGAKRGLVRESVRLLSRTGVRMAGAILNKIDLQRDKYYYSTYYSYYHYGHYGAEEPPKGKPVKNQKNASKAS